MKLRRLVPIFVVAVTTACANSKGDGNVSGPGGCSEKRSGLVMQTRFLPSQLPDSVLSACLDLNCAAEVAGLEAVCVDSCAERADSTCVTPQDIVDALANNPHANYPVILALAFNQIAAGDSELAQQTLEPFLGEENPAETYTYVIASLQRSINALNHLLEPIADQLD